MELNLAFFAFQGYLYAIVAFRDWQIKPRTDFTFVIICGLQGYLYAGTQYGSECFCGNSYGKHGISSACSHSCDGDPTQNCGGYLANWAQSTGLCK